MPSVRKKRAQNKKNYLRKKQNRREASRTKYWENPDKQRAAFQASKNTDKKRAADRASYWKNPDKKRQLPGLVIGRTLSPKEGRRSRSGRSGCRRTNIRPTNPRKNAV